MTFPRYTLAAVLCAGMLSVTVARADDGEGTSVVQQEAAYHRLAAAHNDEAMGQFTARLALIDEVTRKLVD